MSLPITITTRPRTPDAEGLTRQAHTEGGRVSGRAISYPLQFGIYRDGDNNLDEPQSAVLDQAQAVTERDPQVKVNVEDTTQRDDALGDAGDLRTEEYNLVNGAQRQAHVDDPQDMAERSTLTHFVEHTLDQAEKNGATTTWLDLVDHGGGDGGAFQTSMSGGKVMKEDDIARAIADGIKDHAQAHPEDAKRGVDGVLMNACLMGSLGVESALSHAGVRYLAASPETMLAPGVPSDVAEDIVQHHDDPSAMAHAVVANTMHTRYAVEGPAGEERFAPAAAFDVFDLDPHKIATMEQSVKNLNSSIVQAAKDPHAKAAIKADAREVEGMTRSQAPGLPWHADRPAEAVYRNFAHDTSLPAELRTAAQQAIAAISATVLAHGEAKDFAPFGDESYRDASGPTTHLPTSKRQIDPWAPVVSETKTAFARKVGEVAVANALA